MLIHITGASGSGTSTLAAALAQEHAFVHVEADDHYWLPTDPPFSSKRDPSPPMPPVLELSGDITVQDRLAYVLRRMSEMQP